MNKTAHQAVLQLRDIRKVFERGTGEEVIALNGITLDLCDQEFITIIGSNGAGKSTLLNIIGGVFPPEAGGKVIINDDDITNLKEYRHAAYVGRVWQAPEMGTARRLTVEENLALALLRGQPRGLGMAITKQRRQLFHEALAQLGLGLENRMKALVGTLSAGQRQALSLVMATISKPKVLLLDEHTATLDPKTAQTVLELTASTIKRDGISTIMVTHNMEVALNYGNRLIMMHQGRIVADIDQAKKKIVTIGDLVAAFERAAGEQLKDDTILLSGGEV